MWERADKNERVQFFGRAPLHIKVQMKTCLKLSLAKNRLGKNFTLYGDELSLQHHTTLSTVNDLNYSRTDNYENEYRQCHRPNRISLGLLASVFRDVTPLGNIPVENFDLLGVLSV